MRFFSKSRSFPDWVVVSQKSSWFSCVPDFKQSFHIIALSCHKPRRFLPKATSRNFFLALLESKNKQWQDIDREMVPSWCCHDVLYRRKRRWVKWEKKREKRKSWRKKEIAGEENGNAREKRRERKSHSVPKWLFDHKKN